MSTSGTADFSVYTRRMVEEEASRHGDQINAIDRVGRRLGMGAKAVRRLMNGERKTLAVSMIDRIRAAYLETLERKVAALEHEIMMERAKFGEADDLDLLASQVASLAQQVAKAKQKA